jgi:DNA-binding NarL/FixJ family response regulator
VSEDQAPLPEITVFIAEDDPLLRALLPEILKGEEGIRVVGATGDGAEVLEAVLRLRPALLLLDLHLPGLSGLDVLERLAALDESPRVLVLSGHEAEASQLAAARNGARGFVSKSQAITSLTPALRAIADGGVWFGPRVLGQILSDYPALTRKARDAERPLHRLSAREQEVLVRLARGLTNPQIGSELFMSVSTVKVHIRNLLRKLELPNRTDAVVFAVREGLLEAAGAA